MFYPSFGVRGDGRSEPRESSVKSLYAKPSLRRSFQQGIRGKERVARGLGLKTQGFGLRVLCL